MAKHTSLETPNVYLYHPLAASNNFRLMQDTVRRALGSDRDMFRPRAIGRAAVTVLGSYDLGVVDRRSRGALRGMESTELRDTLLDSLAGTRELDVSAQPDGLVVLGSEYEQHLAVSLRCPEVEIQTYAVYDRLGELSGVYLPDGSDTVICHLSLGILYGDLPDRVRNRAESKFPETFAFTGVASVPQVEPPAEIQPTPFDLQLDLGNDPSRWPSALDGVLEFDT
ncbi:MAG TPA: hypothetical protein VJP80_02805 [Candidatus Saccharimonadales bacterium]|nr:hypothetical protein [Candidatus Saccharimonadales bacterium]